MLKYFKSFEEHSSYESYMNNRPILANFDYCEDEDHVHVKHINYEDWYVRTTAFTAGTISFNIWKNMGTEYITSISYSKDNGQTWFTTNNIDNKDEHLQIIVDVNPKDEILWKGIAQQLGFYDQIEDNNVGSFFSSTAEFIVDGNIMSLLYGDNFLGEHTLNYEYMFTRLFFNSDGEDIMSCLLISAYNLRLPTSISYNNCYMDMFYNCTYLKSAPKILPYISTIESYNLYMFQNCTSLIKFPDPILNLDNVTIKYNDNVELNNSFTAKLAATQGNNLLISTVVVKMGTQDITSSVYDHGTRTITIPNVTDIITISAKARIYDAEVEYLQSDGIAYIDTSVVLTKNYHIEIDAAIFDETFNSSNYVLLLGAQTNNSTYSQPLGFNPSGNPYSQIGDGNSYARIMVNHKNKVMRHYICRGDGTTQYISFNNNEISSKTISGNLSSLSMYIFANNHQNGVQNNIVAQVGSIKIIIDDILVRDFIPVCKDGVGYFYDNVSGTLFGNANTQGLFTYGKIEFEDPLVKSICVENWGNHFIYGEITENEAAAVTTLNGKFVAQRTITSFDELKYFTGLTTLYYAYQNSGHNGQLSFCDKLGKITLPAAPITNWGGAFRQTPSLSSLLLDLDMTPITAQTVTLNAPWRETYRLRELKLPGITYTGTMQYGFRNCQQITTIIIDGTANVSSVTSYNNCFLNCSKLTTITGTISNISASINLSACPLNVASATIIVNGLSSSGSGKTCTFKASMQATYEADTTFNAAVTAATANGWSIAFA